MRLIDVDAFRDWWLNNGENEHIYDTNDVLDSIDNWPTLTLPSEWVSAEDDPPKLTGKYICCVEDIHGHMWSISADYLFEMKTWVGEFGEIKNKVVFWMPLPNPPNM